MEGLTYFLHLFHSGGIVMYPLLALSIFTVAIAIERFCYYKANRKDSKRFFTGIAHAVKNQQWDAVDVFCKKNNKPSVIEYIEISKELSEALDENSQLLYVHNYRK